jgi:chemotaxis protein CheD
MNQLPKMLPGYSHVNRYWDKSRKAWIAKILPGQFYVSQGQEMIGTVLGSCISACIWDDYAKVGGMNHFMLPLSKNKSFDSIKKLPPSSDANRYGNYAMEHLINEVLKHGGVKERLQVKLFGGASVMRTSYDIGEQNIAFVLNYTQQEGLNVISQNMGHNFPRKILFDPVTGKALMKRIRSLHNDTIVQREEAYREEIVTSDVGGEVELF